MFVLIAILVFGVLIAIHELGHFLAARATGMRVERFSIGFGPSLATLRGFGTEWTIGALPLGGYVRIAGMNPDEELPPDDPGSYASKPAWQRLVVILAGVAMNYALAWALLFGLMLAGAMVPDPSSKVGSVQPDMPAAAAGLRAGDIVRRVGAVETPTFDALAGAIRGHAGQPVAVELEREGAKLAVTITPTAEGRIGVLRAETLQRHGPLEAASRATAAVVVGSVRIVMSLVDMVRGRAEGEMMGPVGIAAEVSEQARRGLRWLLGVAAQLSLALGFFNLLPLPALDGGRAAFLLVELVRRRPVSPQAEAMVHGLGFLLLLGMILLVTFGDVRRLLVGDRPATPPAQAPAAPR